MTINESSEDFSRVRTFSGIIFDCDGVLIDSTRSYDRALVICFRSFSSLLGYDFDDGEFMNVVSQIRKLGGFNNDWDTLSVMVAYLYSKVRDTRLLDNLAQISPLKERLKIFEEMFFQTKNESKKRISLADLITVISGLQEGTNRDQLTQAILLDADLVNNVRKAMSYPKPVGEGFLSTLFDEVVYGKQVFREMYGFDCSMTVMSNPGLILEEKKMITEEALVSFFSACEGNLGIITGRPRVPTLFTLGDTFKKWFTKPEICFFTGDYILDAEEVKPSPKPMFKVARSLDSDGPILYVGDSGEDLLMAKNANKSGLLQKKVYFAAIASSEEKTTYFESEGSYVDCIVSNVNELGSLLEQNASQSTKIGI